jgi:hypothetical protein
MVLFNYTDFVFGAKRQLVLAECGHPFRWMVCGTAQTMVVAAIVGFPANAGDHNQAVMPAFALMCPTAAALSSPALILPAVLQHARSTTYIHRQLPAQRCALDYAVPKRSKKYVVHIHWLLATQL